jgi:decaprenyl-phosphate phosphoribosyltransferase
MQLFNKPYLIDRQSKYHLKHKLLSIIQLLRPEQWLKNLFIFLPVFFSGNLLNFRILLNTVYVTVIYCLVCSIVYCINDLADIEADRLHPKKKNRPLANESVKIYECFIVMAIILVTVVCLIYALNIPVAAISVLCFYFVMNLAYSFYLKQVSILDVCMIAVGFVLRILIGGYANGIYISGWIVIMTFVLALLMAIAKRREDLLIFQQTGNKPRQNIHQYSLDFINTSLSIVGTIIIVAYIQYTVSLETINRYNFESLYFTSMFVLLGTLRYLQLTLVENKSGDPTKVLTSDPFIQLTLVAWALSFFYIIYIR